MTARRAERTFVDTNVLAYAHDTTDSAKHEAARALLEDLWRSRSGVVSTQVLQEFYVDVTRKLDPPLTRGRTREIIDAYGAWPVIQVDTPMIVTASVVEERHPLSFWDALIVEAARRAGATRLVSEDFQTGRRLGDVTIENPVVAGDADE